jgi:hypothetical protein
MVETYDTSELIKKLNDITDISEAVDDYFVNFSEEQILNKKQLAKNTAYIASNKMRENPIKATITEIFNKFQDDTLLQTEQNIRNLKLTKLEDYNLLITRFIFGMQNDNVNIRNLTAVLCKRMINYGIMINDTKHIISVSIINKCKADFDNAMLLDNDNYTLSFGKKTVLLISVLFNNNLISIETLNDVLSSHERFISNNININKNLIFVENALYQLHWLLIHIDNKIIIEKSKLFLLDFLKLNKEKLNAQVRFTCDVF